MSEAFPDIPIRDFAFRLNENKAVTESSFTRQRNSVTLFGGVSDRWEGSLITPILRPSQVKTMFNFLVKVGMFGRFTLEHPDYDGAASGETLGAVKGAAQSGTSLIADGFTPSIQILAKGEYFQVRDEFKRVTSDIDSDENGDVTLVFKPPLRVSPADDDPIDLASPAMLLEMLSVPSEDTNDLGMQSFTIQFQEALIYE
jgi:hypothetical protein